MSEKITPKGGGQPLPEIGEELEQYLVDITARCPYELPQKAVYHQGMFGSLPNTITGLFLANGYRRNGNCMYAMRCPECNACVPIRLLPEIFVPNPSQQGVW